MSTERQPIILAADNSSKDTASSFWNWLPSSWTSASAPSVAQANSVPNPKVAVHKEVNKTESRTELTKAKEEFLFKDWTKLQSAHSSQEHCIDNYKIIEDAEEDLCIVEVDKEELAASKAASVKAERDYLRKYASIEKIAHELAYQKLENGQMVGVLEEDGSEADYTCQRLQSNHPGLVGYVLLPTKADAKGRYDIKVMFRGTDPSDFYSVCRDFEPKAAGSASFEANSLSLLGQVNQQIKTFAANHAIPAAGISLSSFGHSLGGADAKNFFVKTLKAIAEQTGVSAERTIPSELIDQFALIKKLTVNTANAAGVTLETSQQCKELLKLFAEKRAKGETCFEIPACNQLRVGGDGVQATGEADLGFALTPEAGLKASECAVDICKAHIGSEHHNCFTLPKACASIATGFALGAAPAALATTAVLSSAMAGLYDTQVAHTTKLFKKPREASFEILSNASLAGQKQVTAELNKKSQSLNALHEGVVNGALLFNRILDNASNGFGFREASAPTATPPTLRPARPARPEVAQPVPVKPNADGGWRFWR